MYHHIIQVHSIYILFQYYLLVRDIYHGKLPDGVYGSIGDETNEGIIIIMILENHIISGIYGHLKPLSRFITNKVSAVESAELVLLS